ncbi:hypothetical protein HPB47_014565 [Ixodes persulcatus]|uniref:Uncharacterized protein n=1 Tax=Ixodes persulcatus TaxID=34615 RepID=A0AC60R2R1_IXOPE|nr:hypothetical protein HPB47_014565 [Ixodes persulcatus]
MGFGPKENEDKFFIYTVVSGVKATRQKCYREHLGSLEKRAEEDRRIKKQEIALEKRRLAMEERQIERRLAIEERQHCFTPSKKRLIRYPEQSLKHASSPIHVKLCRNAAGATAEIRWCPGEREGELGREGAATCRFYALTWPRSPLVEEDPGLPPDIEEIKKEERAARKLRLGALLPPYEDPVPPGYSRLLEEHHLSEVPLSLMLVQSVRTAEIKNSWPSFEHNGQHFEQGNGNPGGFELVVAPKTMIHKHASNGKWHHIVDVGQTTPPLRHGLSFDKLSMNVW